MEESGVNVDHSSPIAGWCMDEAYISIKDLWKYLYCAVDKKGDSVDFLLTSIEIIPMIARVSCSHTRLVSRPQNSSILWQHKTA